MVGRSPNSSSRRGSASRGANRGKKVTVRTSGKSGGAKREISKALGAETSLRIAKDSDLSLQVSIDGQQNKANSSNHQDADIKSRAKIAYQAESNNRVGLIFLGIFIAALFFVIGTSFGNTSGKSLVDSAIDELVSNSTNDINRQTLERAAIEGALKASGDEWANYFPSTTLDELNDSTANALTGIGISIREARSGAIEVASVQDGTPALRNGLKVGDQILEVNGADVQGGSLATVVALIRGELGKEVTLRVNRDGANKIFNLLTEKIDVRTVDAAQITPDIAFLSISTFSSGTANEFSEALSSLKSSKGVVIDLRDNPGGLIEEAVSIAEQFIGRGTIVSYRANGEERVFTASNPKPSSVPVVLLINKGTTSAAEILAGAFQDRNRGVVIGQTSFGKGSVQEFMTLKDGSKLELTVALYLTPSGRTIEGVGVIPDLRVTDSEMKIKALQILGGLARLGSKS